HPPLPRPPPFPYTTLFRSFSATIERYSAAVLQRAAMATRLVVLRAADALLPQVEQLYVKDLLSTVDAAEGVTAFLEKRPPRWKEDRKSTRLNSSHEWISYA